MVFIALSALEQNLFTNGHTHWHHDALLVGLARSNSHDHAFNRLWHGVVGEDDATSRFEGLQGLDHNAILNGLVHGVRITREKGDWLRY